MKLNREDIDKEKYSAEYSDEKFGDKMSQKGKSLSRQGLI